MPKTVLSKYSLLSLLGIPLLLLVIFIFFRETEQINISQDIFNKYYKPLPNKYVDAFIAAKKDSSAFFCVINETYGSRELLIFKAFPKANEVLAEFAVNVIPSKTNSISTPVTFNVAGDAIKCNFESITYGYYRAALPFIDIDQLVVKRKVKNKWQKKLDTTIQSPFKIKDIESLDIETAGKGFNAMPNAYKVLFTDALKSKGIEYIPYSFSTVKDSLYQSIPILDEYLKEQLLTIGTIDKPVLFWESLNERSEKLKDLIQFKGENAETANDLIEGLIIGKKAVEEVFNFEKTAQYFAIKELFAARCNDYTYFKYNNETALLEPYFVQSQCLGEVSDFLEQPKINNSKYIELYLTNLNDLLQLDIQNDVIDNNTSFENQLSLINTYDSKNIFDIDVLHINQRMIYQNINDSNALKPELISIEDGKMTLTVLNRSNYPIVIQGLNHEKKKPITSLNPKRIIKSEKKDTITIDLPRSFENLFVSKKNKEIGFKLHKHIYDLFISYSILALDNTYYSPIIPYQPHEIVEEDLFRISPTGNISEDLIVNKEKAIIKFKNKEVEISYPLIIPEGYTFTLEEGTTVDILEGGKIISHSPLNFKGTKKSPIKMFSSDKKGQGLLVLSEGKQNKLYHTIFDHLTNLEHGFWNVTGAVNFYESPVILNNVTVSNNSCEDALNIIRTSFVMNMCTISNTQSDAFDGDFVNGTIKNTKFDTLGNDAIDVSGSDIKIVNVQITLAGDKGLSAGEDSKMAVNKVSISNSEIAIAGKDLSIITVKDLSINNTKLGFTAFQKKSEFGPSNITVTGVVMEGVETNYLIESSSSLFVDGKKIKTSQNVKDRMYGVEFGVSSAETRNKQEQTAKDD